MYRYRFLCWSESFTENYGVINGHFFGIFHGSYIDKGQNPELFTRHQLEQTVADHQAVQKKVEAYKVSIYLNDLWVI